VLARTSEPLIWPDPLERQGYVPNVVYTCGALRFGGRIILPYAVSDTFTRFATIEIAALMRSMGVTAATGQSLAATANTWALSG